MKRTPELVGICLATGIISVATAAGAQSLAAPNEYFWPAFKKSISYKAKSHAIRGGITLIAADDVTIDSKVYKRITVQPKPEGMPGIHREVFLRAEKQGLYARYSAAQGAKEVLTLALPAEKGKTWATYDQDGQPSKRTIDDVGDCDIKGMTFKHCVRVVFESSGGAAVAYYAPEYGEIVNSRKNGFVYRTIQSK
ncbi:MAG: hypothetical protein WBD34_04875 [Burkholderiaceae bacterium]